MRIWLLVLLLTVCAWADRGSIPLTPGVKIYEPNQRALIAWNGRQQILILSTDLRASRPTKVLEVLPLPAEPEVTRSSPEVIQRAVSLINYDLRRGDKMTRSKGGRKPAGRVTQHKRIGAHDIAVTQVLDLKRFVSWVKEYLGDQDVEIPPVLAESVKQYVNEGYRWFVLDTVELGVETVTQDAISYKFQSKELFYPMKISRTDQGQTEVTLVILTPRMLSKFPGIPAEKIELLHRPTNVTPSQLLGVDKSVFHLLKNEANNKLRLWRIRGQLSEFTKDLIGRE